MFKYSPDSSENPFYCFEEMSLDYAEVDIAIKRLQRIAGNSS